MAKSKFTTTLDTELLKQTKIEAIQLDISVAEFLENSLRNILKTKIRSNNPYLQKYSGRFNQPDRGHGLCPSNLLVNDF